MIPDDPNERLPGFQFLVPSSEYADRRTVHVCVYVRCDCSTIAVKLPFHGGRCKRCGVGYH